MNARGCLHAEDLILVVGMQNVGMPLFVSQLGRNIARWAARFRNRLVRLLICLEHSPLLLTQLLWCMESWESGDQAGGMSLALIRETHAKLAEAGALENPSSERWWRARMPVLALAEGAWSGLSASKRKRILPPLRATLASGAASTECSSSLGAATRPSTLIFQYGDLLWNPQADLAAGLRDFCRCYFGDEALAGVFPLEEPVDPRDISAETWDQHIERVSRALETTRVAAADTGDELIGQRLTRLVAEQEHCIAAMRQYSQEAPRDIDRRRDQPPA